MSDTNFHNTTSLTTTASGLMKMSSLIVAAVLTVIGSLLTILANADPYVLNETSIASVIPKDYVIELPRDKTSKEPVVVNVILRADAIRKLNIQTMEMLLDFRLQTAWTDNRLNIIKPNHKPYVVYDEKLRNYFFIPEVNFANHLQCNSKPGGLQPSYDWRLLYTAEYKHLKLEYEKSCIFQCSFDLSDYPFDVQQCSVEIIHIEYYKSNLLLKGYVQDVSYTSGTVVPPEWELSKTYVENCTLLNYPCIKYVFVLKRMLGHHIMTVFVPSILVVILSWISFTLDIEQGPPRVALGLTTLLTLATQFLNAQKGLPPVAYVKAMDVWMIACMLSVFLSLIEYAVANYIHRRWKMRKVDQKMIVRVGSGIEPKKNLLTGTEDHSKSKMIDKIGGIVIASLYTVFVIGFWACFG